MRTIITKLHSLFKALKETNQDMKETQSLTQQSAVSQPAMTLDAQSAVRETQSPTQQSAVLQPDMPQDA